MLHLPCCWPLASFNPSEVSLASTGRHSFYEIVGKGSSKITETVIALAKGTSWYSGLEFHGSRKALPAFVLPAFTAVNLA